MWRVCAVLVVALLGSAGQADTDLRVGRIEAAFAGWLAGHSARGALAIRRQGEVLEPRGFGLPRSDRYDLASVGKAITARCAVDLVGTGELAWDDTVASRVGRGPNITLAQLLTHSGGLKGDATQALMALSFGADVPHGSEMVLNAVTARDGPQGSPGQYRYTNENYALAALMIEAATGEPYHDVCAARALAPLGLQAGVSEVAAISLPWGGWTMTLDDFAMWHATALGGLGDPKDFPHLDVGGGLSYGLGTFFREFEHGTTFWHFGALCFPGRFEIGTYAVTFFADWTLVAVWDACVTFDDMADLDQALVAALFD